MELRSLFWNEDVLAVVLEFGYATSDVIERSVACWLGGSR